MLTDLQKRIIKVCNGIKTTKDKFQATPTRIWEIITYPESPWRIECKFNTVCINCRELRKDGYLKSIKSGRQTIYTVTDKGLDVINPTDNNNNFTLLTYTHRLDDNECNTNIITG